MSYILPMNVFQELIVGRLNLGELSKHQVYATEDQLLLLGSTDVPQKSELLACLKSALPYEVEEPDEEDAGLSIVRNGPDFERLLGELRIRRRSEPPLSMWPQIAHPKCDSSLTSS